MLPVAPSFSTPAYLQSPTLTPSNPRKVARVRKIAHRILRFFFGCRHKHVGFPFENRQTCLDCGGWRHFILNSIFFDSDAPMWIGRWKPADAPADTNRAVASRLIDQALVPDATPQGFPFALGLCIDCGGLRGVRGSCVCSPASLALKARA